jgi:hypothetical protein
MQSAFKEDGDSRPPRSTTADAMSATPGTLAISAPTSPITLRSARPRSASAISASGAR